MSIWIASTIPRTVLIYETFLGISVVPIGMLFIETVDHILSVNAAVKRLVVVAVTTANDVNMGMAEDSRTHELILIILDPAIDDVVVEDGVHIIALTLEE